MDVLGLSLEELYEAARACADLDVSDPGPEDLKRVIAIRCPELAAKVAALEGWQCQELYRVLRAMQRPGRCGP